MRQVMGGVRNTSQSKTATGALRADKDLDQKGEGRQGKNKSKKRLKGQAIVGLACWHARVAMRGQKDPGEKTGGNEFG